MSYTMTMEPRIRTAAEACAVKRGLTLEGLINSCLVMVIKEESEGEKLGRELDEVVSGLPVLDGAPYHFRRADVYEELNSIAV